MEAEKVKDFPYITLALILCGTALLLENADPVTAAIMIFSAILGRAAYMIGGKR